jgi:trimethylamine--corrinoid protein Co-methyltransferase
MVFGFPHALNMRTGSPYFGNISNALFNAAENQVWRDYSVPLRNTASCYTSSKRIDFQNGMERSLAAIISALSGAHTINLHGGVYGELTHSPIQAILDDDLAGMVGRFIQGIEVTDETLALDLIHSVGPVPGHFLDTEHTFRWWKKEQFIEQCADTLTYPEWERAGKADGIKYAMDKMERILAEHTVSTKLTPGQEAEIEMIVREAEAFYRARGELVCRPG